jgi:hypothetical protein
MGACAWLSLPEAVPQQEFEVAKIRVTGAFPKFRTRKHAGVPAPERSPEGMKV